MCGIFGTINYPTKDRCGTILRGLLHRGPDEQNYTEVDNIELYHTRLAIQELSPAGKQPMQYKDLHIVFNGEIYNHLQLRKKYGLLATSGSDTLTILMLFERLGMKMLEEFDGMFAFALYDSRERRLYLARDRAGKKPLYIYRKGSSLVFSSELNTLYKVVQPEINAGALSDYLYLGYNYRQATPYKNVAELENGNYISINTHNNESSQVRWFDMAKRYTEKKKLSYQEALHQLDHKLKKAVISRINSSDLDVGSFLSGGIDSSLITAIAAQHSPQLKTFTVRMDGAYDESSLAKQVADKYGTYHTVVDISFNNLTNDIERILKNYGEPYCDNSAIPSYYVAQAASQHITVVLNGDGADELFGGYRRYVPFRHNDFFKDGGFRKAIARTAVNMLPIANEKKSRYNYIYRLLKLASYKDLSQIYCSASSDLFVGFEDEFLQQPGLTELNRHLESINQMKISSLDKLLLMDFQSILFGLLLPKMDIATMAHSLEGRSPFLSKDILELAPGLPDNYKIKGVTTKYILRDLAKKYLPKDLISQPKRGFEIPLKKWVDNELKDIIASYLLSPTSMYPQLVSKKFVHSLLNRQVKISDERRAKILFSLLGLEVWYKNLSSYQNINIQPNKLIAL